MGRRKPQECLGDEEDGIDDKDDEGPVLLLLELKQHGGNIVDHWTLLPTNHILIYHVQRQRYQV